MNVETSHDGEMMNEDDDIDAEPTAHELAAQLRNDLDNLGWTPTDLRDRMISLGDYRSSQTILRGINRALEGEVKPPGELVALVRQAVRFQRRLQRTYGDKEWKTLSDDSRTIQLEDFTITLSPKTRGRWRVNLMHREGYSPDYPPWQNSLESAKAVALFTLDNALNWMHEYDDEKKREANKKG